MPQAPAPEHDPGRADRLEVALDNLETPEDTDEEKLSARLANLGRRESLEHTIREEIEAYLAEARGTPPSAMTRPKRLKRPVGEEGGEMVRPPSGTIPIQVDHSKPKKDRSDILKTIVAKVHEGDDESARPRLASSPDAEENKAAVDRRDAVTPRVKRLRRKRREAREAAAKGGGREELQEKEDNSFSKAGEEIEKKGTEGVFTAKADKAGMGVQAYAGKVLAKDSKASTKTKRQAAFAKGAATVARENK